MLERGWIVMSMRWGLFFFAMAGLNEFIWRSFSTDFWVTFKLIGFMPITAIFAVTQIRGMAQFRAPKEATEVA